VRGNQVFGECFYATIDSITSTDESFPDEDFFPDISGLYFDDMPDDANTNANLNANANANLNVNVNPPATPYAICSYLFQFLLQFLVLAFRIDVICLSMLDVIYSSILLVCMIRLILAIIIMLYYWLFQIKSYGKLFIFSKIQKPDYRQLNPTGLAAVTRPPPFDGVHYKRWRTRAVLWLKNLGCYSTTLGRPEGNLSPAQDEAFQKVNIMFMGALFNILDDNIVDTYMSFNMARMHGMH
jgi:hypothetical protein